MFPDSEMMGRSCSRTDHARVVTPLPLDGTRTAVRTVNANRSGTVGSAETAVVETATVTAMTGGKTGTGIGSEATTTIVTGGTIASGTSVLLSAVTVTITAIVRQSSSWRLAESIC
jgi:hypothetical protein